MVPGPNTPRFHPHFSPWLADSEQLSRTLVGHEQTLRDFLARLRAVEQGAAANHLLLVGPRGIGKTHLLSLVERYVSDRLPIPADWTGPTRSWVSTLFTEEEYAGQNSLANFLLSLFAKLREALPLEQLWHLPAHLPAGEDQPIIECCFERLQRFHSERRQRVLAVIDNLQKILEQWPAQDHERLRGFLSHNSLLVILGSAPSVFREVLDQNAAFHDFFEIRILPELSSEQVLELLSRRFEEDGRQAEFAARRAELSKKVPAIQVLTGGNPRLVLFLYQIATQSNILDIEIALRRILEELREYFVRRFDELPSQARKVLDTMAQMSGPATPTEIAQAARLKPALVNAQLRRLKEGNYVRPIKLQRQKTTRYDITECLFRIWRQTATVAGRQRFRLLADFLKLYFTPEEVRALYAQHARYLHAGPDVPRDEIVRHVEELFYFQAAGEGEIRYSAFSDRIAGLMKIGESRWADEEAKYFAAESLNQNDQMGVKTAYKTQAAIHTQAGEFGEALGDINRLADLGADEEAASAAEDLTRANPTLAAAWRCRGICVGRLGQYECALDALRQAAAVGNPTADLWAFQALALNSLGRSEEALRCAESAVEMDEKLAIAWAHLGIAAGNLGQHERAFKAFRKAASVGEPTAGLWAGQAITLNNLDRPEEALRCAEAALELDAELPDVWMQLGTAATMLGRYERALEAFRKAASVGKPTAGLSVHQALALSHLGRWEEALHCAETALELDAELPAAWMQLGIAAAMLGRYERTLEALRRAASVGKPTAELSVGQALALNLLGRWEEALHCAESAVEMDAELPAGWTQLGTAANNLGRYEQALEAFTKAVSLGKPTAMLSVLQASALRHLGRVEESLSAIESGLALDPGSATLSLEKAWVLAALGRFDDALGSLEQAREHGASARDYHHARGDLLLLYERFAEALSELEAGLEVQPDDWDLATDRLIALACLGQQGPQMEALPGALARVPIPPPAEPTVCSFLHDVALNSVRRGEVQIARGLFATTLQMPSWHGTAWLGRQLGTFLRRVLDMNPEILPEFVALLSDKIRDEGVLKLLDPFLKASDLLRTRDVTILERLFPEVRELVLDIVRRIDPDFHGQLARLM